MGKWADQFSNRFRDDRTQANVDKQLAVQRSQTVKTLQGSFWGRFKDTAVAAVNDINTSERVLEFLEPDLSGGGLGFRITYHRDSKPRAAKAVFSSLESKVDIVIDCPGRHPQNKSFIIEATNDNQLQFVSDGKHQTEEEIVQWMLSSLL